MTVLPAEIAYGKVVGRFLLAIADSVDADRNPDAKAATGTITFTPVSAIQYASLPVPTTIVKQRIVCNLNVNGELADSQGAVGVWLVAGQQYDVSYNVENATLETHRILVSTTHDDTTPLDLTLAAPLPVTPAVTYIVNQQLYLDTVAARDAAQAAAASMTIKVGIPFSVNGNLVLRTGTNRYYNDTGKTLTISSVRASVGTSPSGSSVIVDVHKDGTTIFTTQSNRPTITPGGTTSLVTTIESASFPAGSFITVDIDQIGSTVAGADLTVSVVLTG